MAPSAHSVLALVAAASAALTPARAQQQSLALTFDAAAALHEVSGQYVCFNIDTGSLYNGMDFTDTVFRTLVRQLTLGGSGAGSIIRIGGTAVDSSFYFPKAPYHIGAPNQCGGNCPNGSSDIGNAMLTAVYDFIGATGMSLLWDVNGADFRDGTGPWSAAGNATAMLSFIDSQYGGKVNYAYSVGNEREWAALCGLRAGRPSASSLTQSARHSRSAQDAAVVSPARGCAGLAPALRLPARRHRAQHQP